MMAALKLQFMELVRKMIRRLAKILRNVWTV
jgi:hypothetical protein